MDRPGALLERVGALVRAAMMGIPSLRIAMMLESDGPGGAEMMVLRLSEELRQRGHSVVPVGPAHGAGWLGGHFRRAGFTPEVFHLKRPIDPGCVRGLVNLFRQHHISAVHSHEFTMAVYGTAASRLLNLPHVITMHGGLSVTKALRRRIALRWAMRNSDHAVTVSGATQRQFAADLGVDKSSFTIVHNGVPTPTGDASGISAEFGINRSDCVLLAVGTLEAHKGHRFLLQALALLDGQGVNVPWKLIIAGGRGGDQHESLLQYVRQAGLTGRAHIVTNRDDVPDLLARADVFVMPSLIEGLPLALLEAMHARKAIIASVTAGIPEAIEHDRDGLMVPPGDVEALSRAIRLLLTDPARRQTLAEAAAGRARREFTIQLMAQRYEALYVDGFRQRIPRIAERAHENQAVAAS